MINPDSAAAVQEIMRRHAKMTRPGGVPVICMPPAREVADRERAGSKPARTPIIYPNLQAAQAAELEMRRVDGVRQYAYVCPRSRSGHAHLSTDPPRDPNRR